MTVLVIAPHPDDEILGCGGVIAKRAEAGDDVWVCIMSEGKRPMYSKEFIKEEFREMQIAHSNVGVGHFIRVALPTARLDTIPQYKLNGILILFTDIQSLFRKRLTSQKQKENQENSQAVSGPLDSQEQSMQLKSVET